MKLVYCFVTKLFWFYVYECKNNMVKGQIYWKWGMNELVKTTTFCSRSNIICHIPCPSAVMMGWKSSDNYLISDFFSISRTMPEISVNLKRKFLGEGGFRVPQVHLVGDFMLQMIKVLKSSGTLPPNPLHFMHPIFCPPPHEVRKGDYWIRHRLSVRPSVRPLTSNVIQKPIYSTNYAILNCVYLEKTPLYYQGGGL